jgi:hypothetical protein
MSQPNPKSELHELVDDYCHEQCGRPEDAGILHEEIDRPEKRSWLYDCFIEYVEDFNQ